MGVGILAVLVAGCAQVGSPGGGGRDETPLPWSLRSGVRDHQLVRGRLLLTFDEFVQVKDARNQLVSPPLPARRRCS